MAYVFVFLSSVLRYPDSRFSTRSLWSEVRTVQRTTLSTLSAEIRSVLEWTPRTPPFVSSLIIRVLGFCTGMLWQFIEWKLVELIFFSHIDWHLDLYVVRFHFLTWILRRDQWYGCCHGGKFRWHPSEFPRTWWVSDSLRLDSQIQRCYCRWVEEPLPEIWFLNTGSTLIDGQYDYWFRLNFTSCI